MRETLFINTLGIIIRKFTRIFYYAIQWTLCGTFYIYQPENIGDRKTPMGHTPPLLFFCLKNENSFRGT